MYSAHAKRRITGHQHDIGANLDTGFTVTMGYAPYWNGAFVCVCVADVWTCVELRDSGPSVSGDGAKQFPSAMYTSLPTPTIAVSFGLNENTSPKSTSRLNL